MGVLSSYAVGLLATRSAETVMRRHASTDRNAHAQKLARAMEVFSARAEPSELATLTRIIARWPAMRTVTKDALFASVVVEFKGVREVENVPR
jgi:hypothetical protein